MSDANRWDESDYLALTLTAIKCKFRPEDWLAVTGLESGIASFRAGERKDKNGKPLPGCGPFALNPNGLAAGLNQMMPATQKNLGFKAGSRDWIDASGDYRELSIAKQIEYSGRYFSEWRLRFKLESFARAGDLYLCNFMPAFLPFKDAPQYVLTDRTKKTYQVNRGLDVWQFGKEWSQAYELNGRKYKGVINVQDMTIAATRGKAIGAYSVAVKGINRQRQGRLNEWGQGEAPLAVDGAVGPKTLAVLASFQGVHGIALSGAFDAATDEALFA